MIAEQLSALCFANRCFYADGSGESSQGAFWCLFSQYSVSLQHSQSIQTCNTKGSPFPLHRHAAGIAHAARADDGAPTATLHSITTKRLSLSRAFVVPKQAAGEPGAVPRDSMDDT
jgi:hypothetical protein